MSPIHIEVSEVIDARPAAVYALLRDYQQGHPAILPKPYFTGLTLESGSQGAGTVFEVRMEVYGMKLTYHMTVSEPEPGRVLVETDEARGVVTRFIVDPLDGGEKTQLTIATDSRPSPGVMGLMQRLMNPPITRRIYRAELQNIANYLRGQ